MNFLNNSSDTKDRFYYEGGIIIKKMGDSLFSKAKQTCKMLSTLRKHLNKKLNA